ncbi:MAG TPA: hypothetical protein VJ255_07735 [Candidatus Acidoferrum sp.]|nr:hypothetical protein [Candidatus Acidoferrum sp.]
MPDWSRLISERMGVLALSGAVRDEVVAELATHLEELYQACRARGASESQAIEIALSQATDWQELGREISDIKNEEARTNDRSKQLWLPGLMTLTASMVWLMMPQRVNWNLGSSSFHESPPLMAYLMWLITHPVFGAAGAYLSRRNGGTLIARLAAGIFPSIALLGLLIFITFTGFFVERNPSSGSIPHSLPSWFFPGQSFPRSRC